MGILGLKSVWKILETHREINEKPLKNYARKKNEIEKNINKVFFKFYSIFNWKTNLSQKCDFENIAFRAIDKKHNA